MKYTKTITLITTLLCFLQGQGLALAQNNPCGPPKRVFHCIVYPAGLFWQAHLLAYSDSSTRSDAGAVRVRPSEAGAVLSTPTDGRTGAGFGTNAHPGACRPGSGCSSSAPQASAGRPRRVPRPDGGGHRLPPVWPPPEGQSGFLLRLWPAVSI